MTYKQIQAASEVRKWVTQIIAPVVIVTAAVVSNPKVRFEIARKVNSAKETINKKFKKD